MLFFFSSFNPFPSSPFLTADDSKKFQCSDILIGNKTRPLFVWIFNWVYVDAKTQSRTYRSAGRRLVSPGDVPLTKEPVDSGYVSTAVKRLGQVFVLFRETSFTVK